MKVAIATDWLTSFGGGERVLQHVLRVFPGAPVYTSVYDPSTVPADVHWGTVRTSVLQHFPGVRSYSRALLPLMPWAFARMDLREFDVVISASSAFSKNIRVRDDAINLCYCHTPPRYLWDLGDEYRRRIPGSAALSPLVTLLRKQDL